MGGGRFASATEEEAGEASGDRGRQRRTCEVRIGGDGVGAKRYRGGRRGGRGRKVGLRDRPRLGD